MCSGYVERARFPVKHVECAESMLSTQSITMWRGSCMLILIGSSSEKLFLPQSNTLSHRSLAPVWKAQPILDICRWASSMLFFFALNGNFSKTHYFWGQITLEMFFTWEKLMPSTLWRNYLCTVEREMSSSLPHLGSRQRSMSDPWDARPRRPTLASFALCDCTCLRQNLYSGNVQQAENQFPKWTTPSGRAWEC